MELTLVIALLALAAVVLAVAELILPTGGILGVMAILAALAAVACTFAVNVTFGVISLVVLLVASPFIAWLGMRLWESSPVGRRVILHDEVGVATVDRIAIGARGTTVSTLRPTGEAEINGQTIQAESEFGELPPGTEVVVIAFADNLATVRPITEPQAATA
jgi:membrane-bound ClpP family serine protease